MGESTTKHKKRLVVIPRRTPSVVVEPPQPIYVTPDKTTCLSAGVVDRLQLPVAFGWSVDDESIIANKITGMLEVIRFCRSIGLPPRKLLSHCT
ncbi:unnamed protein product [Leptidea sinapis]|uniref:Uncharacterized protein n=1 Tax=Leptidea sinapis TaxID=189913 RepID=A0A5E4PQL8_9NEOP|nr:unnamed protein product [Leptidea sinapis]